MVGRQEVRSFAGKQWRTRNTNVRAVRTRWDFYLRQEDSLLIQQRVRLLQLTENRPSGRDESRRAITRKSERRCFVNSRGDA